jgi:hypothetical protein
LRGVERSVAESLQRIGVASMRAVIQVGDDKGATLPAVEADPSNSMDAI